MHDLNFIDSLKKRLIHPLPGSTAQSLMAPITRDRYYEVPQNHKVACVLALFFPKDQKWHLAFIERKSHLSDKHGGQIGFPGGKYEKEDFDFEACALRETEEEIGVGVSMINVIGNLSPLYVFVSNYKVHPFVGYCSRTPEFTKQETEVESILEIPIDYLLQPHIVQVKDIPVRDIIIKEVPFYNIFGKTLWGATAMIVSELLEIIRRQPSIGNRSGYY